jgi:hypothetical protein
VELRYCETCGDIIQLQAGTPLDLGERFVCSKCRSAAGEGSRPDVRKPPATSIELQDLLAKEELNLFSKGTIAVRKKAQAQASMPRSGLVRLAPESDPRQLDGQAPVESSAARAAQAPPAGPQAAPNPQEEKGGAPGGRAEGSALPASRAQKILFSCLHCRKPLSIRPVTATSRLSCPHCMQPIYVTVSGQMLRQPPSAAIRKEKGIEAERPAQGSTARPAAGSARGVPQGASKTAEAGLLTTHPSASRRSVRIQQPAAARGSAGRQVESSKSCVLTEGLSQEEIGELLRGESLELQLDPASEMAEGGAAVDHESAAGALLPEPAPLEGGEPAPKAPEKLPPTWIQAEHWPSQRPPELIRLAGKGVVLTACISFPLLLLGAATSFAPAGPSGAPALLEKLGQIAAAAVKRILE